jgi:hypothetical protein
MKIFASSSPGPSRHLPPPPPPWWPRPQTKEHTDYSREYLDWRWPLSCVHSVMIEFLVQLAQGKDANPPFFTLSTPSILVLSPPPHLPRKTSEIKLPEVEITKKQIHRLAYKFSIDFSLLGLAYGFFPNVLDFFYGKHKHLTKVLDF